MRIREPEIKRARIEIVPMIDTIFFLLVFFMIASLAMTTMTGIKVALPKASTGEKTAQARVILTMTADGDIYLKKRRIGMAEVATALRREVEANPRVQVIINADKSLRYGKVVALIDEAKRANPSVLSIATEPDVKVR
ncbi:MAG: ExbD/TolR family protein [Armatimonadota bacterium]